MRISAVIISKNEEANIQRCIESAKRVADEIVLIDSGSQDRTCQIADQLGARVLQREWEGYGKQKNWGNEQVAGDYILSLDADEVLSEELVSSIQRLDFSKAAYSFPRKNFYGNSWIRFGGWYPDRKVRLWKKGKAHWSDKSVHEELILEKGIEIKSLKAPLLHFSFANQGEHLQTVKRYSKIRGAENAQAKKVLKLEKQALKGGFKFLKTYLLKAAFLHGKAGFQISRTSGLRYLMDYGFTKKRKSQDKLREGVTVFLNTTKAWGGGEKWHLEHARLLQSEGINCEVWHRKDSVLGEKARKDNIPVKEVALGNLDWLLPWKLWVLIKKFEKGEVKTVIVNSSKDLKVAGLAAFFAGVPHIIYRRGLAKAAKNSFINQFLFNVVCNQVLLNSHETQRLLFSKIDLNPNQIASKIIRNPVSIPKSPDLEKPLSSPIQLGTVGRLVEQKGFDLLLESLGKLKKRGLQFQCNIAGEGPLRKVLEDQCRALDLEKEVTFLGFVEQPSSLYPSFDLYLCSSRFEGFGYALAEAMAHGKACIAFDCSSNPELIEHQENGLLVPAFDTVAFSKACEQLIREDVLRQRLGKAAHQFVKANLQRKQQHAAFLAFIQQGY